MKLTICVDSLCNRMNDGNNFAFHAKDEVGMFLLKLCLRKTQIRSYFTSDLLHTNMRPMRDHCHYYHSITWVFLKYSLIGILTLGNIRIRLIIYLIFLLPTNPMKSSSQLWDVPINTYCLCKLSKISNSSVSQSSVVSELCRVTHSLTPHLSVYIPLA